MKNETLIDVYRAIAGMMSDTYSNAEVAESDGYNDWYNELLGSAYQESITKHGYPDDYESWTNMYLMVIDELPHDSNNRIDPQT